MKSIQDTMYPKSPLTENERKAIAEVQDMAICYADLDQRSKSSFRHEVRTLTSGRQRWLATRNTPPDHPAYRPLMTLLDDLIADDDLIKTEKGWFSRDDLAAAEATIVRENGQELILFPVAHPWHVKPDKETGLGGIRADAIYRPAHERRPSLTTFRVTPLSQPTVKREKEWWEK